jgi:NitT/TauT family transport system substrate-binding protein
MENGRAFATFPIKSLDKARKERPMRLPRRLAALAGLAAATLALAACGGPSDASGGGSGAAVTTLRLGFFPNVTHAPALVGLQEGLFTKALEEAGVSVAPTAFNAGPDAITALFGGSVDISYIGPNPTINAYAQSEGAAIRVISGAASGGAALVVKPGITDAQGLKGKTIATPQLGNTQDVAFRYWLKQQGLNVTSEGGGDLSIKPQANAEGLAAYASGSIDGAWVPQPWVAEYVKAGAKVLVDEKTLWPEGKFVTTNIIVRTEFLEQHPDIVTAFLEGNEAALDFIAKDPAAAKTAVNSSLQSLTGSSLDQDVLDAAFADVEFTNDPLPATLAESANHAIEVGLLEKDQLDAAGGLPGKLYSLDLLNEVLKAQNKAAVSAS